MTFHVPFLLFLFFLIFCPQKNEQNKPSNNKTTSGDDNDRFIRGDVILTISLFVLPIRQFTISFDRLALVYAWNKHFPLPASSSLPFFYFPVLSCPFVLLVYIALSRPSIAQCWPTVLDDYRNTFDSLLQVPPTSLHTNSQSRALSRDH